MLVLEVIDVVKLGAGECGASDDRGIGSGLNGAGSEWGGQWGGQWGGGIGIRPGSADNKSVGRGTNDAAGI